MSNKSKTLFTRTLTSTQTALGIFVILPLFLYCTTYISSAITKFIILTFNLSVSAIWVSLSINMTADLIVASVCLILLWDFLSPQFKDFFRHPGKILIGALIGLALSYGANIVSNILLTMLNASGNSANQSAVENILKNYPAYMAINTIILAPIAEEFVFRGVIFTAIRKHNRFLAYLVSALAFGFVHVMSAVFAGHMDELLKMIPYSAMGAVFAYVHEHNDNICGSIGTHMLLNGIATSIILFLGS